MQCNAMLISCPAHNDDPRTQAQNRFQLCMPRAAACYSATFASPLSNFTVCVLVRKRKAFQFRHLIYSGTVVGPRERIFVPAPQRRLHMFRINASPIYKTQRPTDSISLLLPLTDPCVAAHSTREPANFLPHDVSLSVRSPS